MNTQEHPNGNGRPRPPEGDKVDLDRKTFGGLTVRQQYAIDLLLAGNTDLATAKKVGVHRTTVTRWRLESPLFLGHLNRRRADVWSASGQQLRSLLPKAVDVIDRALEGEEVSKQALRAALALVKMAGLGCDPAAIDRPELVDPMNADGQLANGTLVPDPSWFGQPLENLRRAEEASKDVAARSADRPIAWQDDPDVDVGPLPDRLTRYPGPETREPDEDADEEWPGPETRPQPDGVRIIDDRWYGEPAAENAADPPPPAAEAGQVAEPAAVVGTGEPPTNGRG